MTLTQLLVTLVALLPMVLGAGAAALAGYIRTDGWNRYINEAIAATFILLAAIATVLCSGRLTGNWNADLATFQATLSPTVSGVACRPLMLWLQSNTRTPATPPPPSKPPLPAGWSTLPGGNDTSG